MIVLKCFNQATKRNDRICGAGSLCSDQTAGTFFSKFEKLAKEHCVKVIVLKPKIHPESLNPFDLFALACFS